MNFNKTKILAIAALLMAAVSSAGEMAYAMPPGADVSKVMASTEEEKEVPLKIYIIPTYLRPSSSIPCGFPVPFPTPPRGGDCLIKFHADGKLEVFKREQRWDKIKRKWIIFPDVKKTRRLGEKTVHEVNSLIKKVDDIPKTASSSVFSESDITFLNIQIYINGKLYEYCNDIWDMGIRKDMSENMKKLIDTIVGLSPTSINTEPL